MKVYKFGRNATQRSSLMRGLAAELVLHGRVKTTLAKAKALRPKVEHLVTAAAKGTPGQRTVVLKFFYRRAVAEKMLAEIGPRFKGRPGGYTRIIRTGSRSGDNAPTAVIEWVA